MSVFVAGVVSFMAVAGCRVGAEHTYAFVGPPDYRLTVAAHRGDFALVKKLLKSKVAVNCTDERGQTALMAATMSGSHKILKLLLACGADVKAKQDNDYTAFDMCPYSTPECAEELAARLPAPDKSWLNWNLHQSIRFSNSRMVAWFLKQGADPNFRDDRLLCSTGMTKEEVRNYKGPTSLKLARQGLRVA